MKQSQKRTREIKIRFLDHELEELNRKVRKTGMSREAYCREVLNGSEVKEGPSADVPLLLREVRQNNVLLDQLVQARGELEGVRLAQLLDQIQEVEQMIVEAYSLRH